MKHHSSKKLDDHLGRRAEALIDGDKWIAQEAEVKSDALIDNGSGRPIILRSFQFGLPTGIPNDSIPSSQEIIKFHWKKLEVFLWKDGLEMIEEPRVVFDTKNKLKFTIFTTCQAKKGTVFSYKDTPNLLQNATGNQPVQ